MKKLILTLVGVAAIFGIAFGVLFSGLIGFFLWLSGN